MLPSSACTSASSIIAAPPRTQAISADGPATADAFCAPNSQPEPMIDPTDANSRPTIPTSRWSLCSTAAGTSPADSPTAYAPPLSTACTTRAAAAGAYSPMRSVREELGVGRPHARQVGRAPAHGAPDLARALSEHPHELAGR